MDHTALRRKHFHLLSMVLFKSQCLQLPHLTFFSNLIIITKVEF